MNALLWTLQALLALHTLMGAFWKFSNSEQQQGALSQIPHAVWLLLAVVEILCVLAFLAPVLRKKMGHWVPIASAIIALEMLFFCGLHFSAGAPGNEPIYWGTVALLCLFLAYGRWKIRPL